jgi:hypothetical protein
MYVGYGVLIAMIVRMQGCRFFSTVCDDQQMHYAVALAFILEGTLSAAYHICPTSNTLQYDYLGISLLMIMLLVTIYAKRHACPPSAFVVFVCFSYLYAMVLWSERIQWLKRQSKESTERTAFLVLAILFFILVGPLCLAIYIYFYTSTEFRGALWQAYYDWRGSSPAAESTSPQLASHGFPSAPVLAANTIDTSLAGVVVRATEVEMRDRGAKAEASDDDHSLVLFKRTVSDSVHSLSPDSDLPKDLRPQGDEDITAAAQTKVSTNALFKVRAGESVNDFDLTGKPPPRSPAATVDAAKRIKGAVGVAVGHAVDDAKKTVRNPTKRLPRKSVIQTLVFGASHPSVSTNSCWHSGSHYYYCILPLMSRSPPPAPIFHATTLASLSFNAAMLA